MADRLYRRDPYAERDTPEFAENAAKDPTSSALTPSDQALLDMLVKMLAGGGGGAVPGAARQLPPGAAGNLGGIGRSLGSPTEREREGLLGTGQFNNPAGRLFGQ